MKDFLVLVAVMRDQVEENKKMCPERIWDGILRAKLCQFSVGWETRCLEEKENWKCDYHKVAHVPYGHLE